MITPGVGAGGEIKRVHQEFDDGYVIGIFQGCDYVPLVFSWNDVFDCPEDAILTSGDLFHNRLMRKDGGVVRKEYNSRILFDWNEMEKVITGYSKSPEGDLLENYKYQLNSSCDTGICGADGNTVETIRLDRFYWTPGNITQNDSGEGDLFSATQIAHSTCPFNTDGCVNEWHEDASSCYIIDNGEL